MTTRISGNIEDDYDSLVIMVGKLQDAHLDFLANPGVDELSEVSSWTTAVLTFCDALEKTYGSEKADSMAQCAWGEVRV
jgi:hypothetical protein